MNSCSKCKKTVDFEFSGRRTRCDNCYKPQIGTKYLQSLGHYDSEYKGLSTADQEYLAKFDSEFIYGFGLNQIESVHPRKYSNEIYKEVRHRREDVLNQPNVIIISDNKKRDEHD